jgi:Methane oxygenase PmoA
MTILPLLLLALASPQQPAATFHAHVQWREYIEVRYPDKEKRNAVGRFMTAYDISDPKKREETYKPYLHILDPETGKPITKGAGGEFTHHRGIFIGWNKLTVAGKTYDRWHMTGGEQVVKEATSSSSLSSIGQSAAIHAPKIVWTGATRAETLIEESRTMHFMPPPTGAFVQVDFLSELKAVAGDTIFDGDPEHAGLHFRPTDATDRANTIYLYPKAGANAHKDRDYPWVGMTYTAEGQKYSVVMLSHPQNPTGTAWSAYRNYGRFGAFYKTAIKKDETLKIQARFVVYKGELPSPEAIQALWNGYTGKKEPLAASTRKPSEQPAPKK